MKKIEKNRFAKKLEEAKRNSPHADMEMLRELDLIMEQMESLPPLPTTAPYNSKKPSLQPIPLRLVRQCFG